MKNEKNSSNKIPITKYLCEFFRDREETFSFFFDCFSIVEKKGKETKNQSLEMGLLCIINLSVFVVVIYLAAVVEEEET